MKNSFITKLLTIIFALCSVFLLATGCAKHEHSFTKQVVADKYFISPATCTEKAKYHLSCECGESGEESFEHGEVLGHSFTNYISDNNATYTEDGTKTATCDRDDCDATDTIVEENTKLVSHISFNTLTIEDLNANGIVANEKEEFNFNNEITINGNVDFIVSYDQYGSQQVLTKIVPLNQGDNIFYIFEMQNGNITKTFKVIIRRKPMYNVYFYTQGTSIEGQTIEEGNLATMPSETPERAGYTFMGWDYDFDLPITRNTYISAIWQANTNTPYKVEYYFENIEDSNYTIDNSLTKNLTGTTDTTVSITADNIEHFTFNSYKSNLSGNLNGNGSLVLKLYYTRNVYNVQVAKENNKGTVAGANTFKYGNQATVTATVNTGYTFLGWYNGEERVSTELVYTFNPIANTTLTAKWQANTNTPYKVEYYFENIEDSNYTIDNSLTKNLTGTTDTTVSITADTIEHFTFNSYKSNLSGNLNGNGSLILKLYYTRNKYSLLKDSSFKGEITNSGSYKYGKVITTIASVNLGYNFVGWYSGGTLLSTDTTYTFTIDKDIVAKSALKEEMAIFSFSSTLTTCEITGLKDKTKTEIVIPDYVTSIGSYAFRGCSSLTSIVIPDSVTSIGEGAVSGCDLLTIYCEAESQLSGWDSYWNTNCPIVWDCKNNDIADDGYIYTVVDGIRYSIKDNQATVVGQAKNITTVVIKKSITYKGTNYSVTSIGYSAFYGCSSLTSVVIPNSVTSIDGQAFYNCTSLTSVNYLGTIESWVKIEFGGYGANPLSYAKNLYINGELVTEAVISTAIKINDYAFYWCDSLTSVVIGNSVTSIGNSAFSGCKSLTNIVIPDSVTSIGDFAFNTCDSLTSVEIGNGVTSIGDFAFLGCDTLVEVYNKSSLKITKGSSNYGYVGYYALNIYTPTQGASKLTTDSNGYIIYTDGSEKILVGYNGSETDLILPNGITQIYKNAFYNNYNITSIVIPDSVTSIGYEAFSGCSKLTSVVIGDSVTSIGASAFFDCTQLASVVIPNSVTSIGRSAFCGCDSLTIYCEVAKHPYHWDSSWNTSNCPVVWGYKG